MMVPAIGSRTNAKIVTVRAAGLALTLTLSSLRSLSPSAPPSHGKNADRAATDLRWIGHQIAGQEPQAEAEP